MAEKQIQPQQPAEKKELKKFENVTERVLDRIEKFQADGALILPANYAVENHMKSAWLVLQATKDKDNRPVIDACTKDSIANSLFDMVLQGLSVARSRAISLPMAIVWSSSGHTSAPLRWLNVQEALKPNL